jgi:hypothetical protein
MLGVVGSALLTFRRGVLDKPPNGGFALSRIYASAILAAFIAACLLIVLQRTGNRPGTVERNVAIGPVFIPFVAPFRST